MHRKGLWQVDLRGRIVRRCALLFVLSLSCLRAAWADGYTYMVDIEAADDLKTLLEKNLDIVRWRDNPRIDAAQLRRFLRRVPDQVTGLLETQGYYAPSVTTRIDDAEGHPQAVIIVDPGALTVVGQVDLQFTDGCTAQRSARLRASWRLPSGQPFLQSSWEGAKSALLLATVGEETPQASIAASEARVDPATHRADLLVKIDCGPVIHMGQLEIDGLHFFDPVIVTNLNPTHPGEPYKEAAIQLFQTRLQDSGYFSNVMVGLDPNQSGETRDVRVQLTENKRKKMGIGIGYSTNTYARGQLDYSDLDVWGLRLSSKLLFETIRQKAQATLSWPTRPRSERDSLGVKYQRETIQGQTTETASVAASRVWGAPWLERTLTLEAVAENQLLPDTTVTHSRSMPLTYRVSLRRLNDILFPTQGYLFNAQAGVAVRELLSDRSFVRLYAQGNKFYAFDAKARNLMIVRGEIGAALSSSRDGIPEDYLFRTGGDQSVRGYAYQSLGVAEGGAIVGGRYMATASLELQHWFLANWGVAAFYDAGNAGDDLPTFRLKSGYGIGLRWKSRVGPINLDAAYGRATSEYRLHFSFGASF